MGTAYAVSQSELAVGLEATRGTAAATKLWIPVKGPKYKPNLMLISDNTLQGSMVETYDEAPALRYDGHGWDSFPYLDSFPVFLEAELGSADTKTTAPASTTVAAAGGTKGATTIAFTLASVANSYYVINPGGATQETIFATNAATSVTTAWPLVFSHVSTEVVTGLTKHQFSLLNNAGSGNQPPSVTITDYDGEEWRQLTAAQLDQLTIKGNASGFVDYTCSWFANPSTTPGTPTPSFSTARAVPGWTTQIAIGGSYIGYVEDWELDLKRGVKPIPALTGTQAYFSYFASALQSSGKLTVIEQSGAPELTKYLNGSKFPLDITVFDLGSGFAMNLHSSSAIFKTGELDRGANGEVKAQLQFQSLPTAADALAGGVSPILATVANSTTTAYAGS